LPVPPRLTSPPVPSTTRFRSGFTFRLQDRGGLGREALLAARGQLLMQANQHPVIAYARPEGLEDAPQLQMDIDRAAANAQGVPRSEEHTSELQSRENLVCRLL